MTGDPRRPLTTRDLLRFQMADDPQLSPTGDAVAWVRTWIDADANAYRRAYLYHGGSDGPNTRADDK